MTNIINSIKISINFFIINEKIDFEKNIINIIDFKYVFINIIN